MSSILCRKAAIAFCLHKWIHKFNGQRLIFVKYAKKNHQFLGGFVALHYNFDTRDDCSKRVQLVGANRVQRMRLLPIKLSGQNRGMHPHRVYRVQMHRVQLLHAEVSVHPHRVQIKYSPKDGHRKYAPSREMDSPYSNRPVLWTVKYTRSTKVDIENSTARQTDDRVSVTSKIGGDILR